MGNFLDAPITDKETITDSVGNLRYGMSAMQGWRVDMEDAHTLVKAMPGMPDSSFFAVFDGHGGSLAARYSAENLLDHLTATSEFQEGKDPETIGRAMKAAHFAIDETLRTLPAVANGDDRSGCTAVHAVISPTHIIVSNTGDSRSILGRRPNETVAMSEDHKPYDAPEQERIEAAGGTVTMRRVNGDLAVSRALGDFDYKRRSDLPAAAQQVSAEPDIRIEERSPDDEFLVIACDGIWDVMTNDECCGFVRELLNDGESDCGLICEELLDVCLMKNSRDNMSAVVILFEGATIGQGDGVMGRRAAREADRLAREKDQTGGQ